MELPLYNQNAENIGTVELTDNVFGLPMNQDLLYQVITSQMSNKRQVLAHARAVARFGRRKETMETKRHRPGSSRFDSFADLAGWGVTGGPTKKEISKDINKR